MKPFMCLEASLLISDFMVEACGHPRNMSKNCNVLLLWKQMKTDRYITVDTMAEFHYTK